MQDNPQNLSKPNLLAVLLEDYFHVGAFHQLIQSGQWYRFASRYEQSTLTTLDLLDCYQTKATFFVLGWIADRSPDLIREIARRGHEIASRGFYYRQIHQMTPEEFRRDLLRTQEALERACGQLAIGHRAVHPWHLQTDRWALEILAREGYWYDTSVRRLGYAPNPEAGECFAHELKFDGKRLWEFPVSTCNLLGWRMPISGGNYFRQFPHTLMKRAVARWRERYDDPFVMYFHVWELDRQQPRISGASSLARLRHYRNLGKMSWVMEHYLSEYPFTSFAAHLGAEPLTSNVAAIESNSPREVISLNSQPSSAGRQPVSIVIPCYNEELILPYLDNTLKSVEAKLSDAYELQFIFVDDCSTDGTFYALKQIFSERPGFRVVRHSQNRGVAAAIMTGIQHAQTEIVCSMDCDCTYDPHELARMIPLLTEGVDLVTASPYHEQGMVRNVPPWRLTLSKGASFLYRQVLNQKLATYTSCFRVYRRSAMADLKLDEDGFLGVAEMLGRLDLNGSKIVEYPATLEVRLFGRSKMKLLKTILGHLKLLTRLLRLRLSGGAMKTETSPDPAAPANKSLSGTAPAAGPRR